MEKQKQKSRIIILGGKTMPKRSIVRFTIDEDQKKKLIIMQK
jgi:hypothetical protein